MIHEIYFRPERVPHLDVVRRQIETLRCRVRRDERIVQAEREVVFADVVGHAYFGRRLPSVTMRGVSLFNIDRSALLI